MVPGMNTEVGAKYRKSFNFNKEDFSNPVNKLYFYRLIESIDIGFNKS